MSIVESLSIPIQQMSRVIVDGNIIDDEDAKLIEKVIPIEEVKNLYLNNVSDPVKFYISRNKTDGIIIENKYEFLKLYIKWLFKYKTSYIKAFIDETNGYYNGSYSKNWLVEAGYVGIEKVNINFEPISKSFYKFMIALIHFWTNSDLTSIFIGLGFNFFIFVLLVLKTIYNKKNLIPYFLVISVFITLVLATPVWSEYRYFYSLILTLPFYLSINTN